VVTDTFEEQGETPLTAKHLNALFVVVDQVLSSFVLLDVRRRLLFPGLKVSLKYSLHSSNFVTFFLVFHWKASRRWLFQLWIGSGGESTTPPPPGMIWVRIRR